MTTSIIEVIQLFCRHVLKKAASISRSFFTFLIRQPTFVLQLWIIIIGHKFYHTGKGGIFELLLIKNCLI